MVLRRLDISYFCYLRNVVMHNNIWKKMDQPQDRALDRSDVGLKFDIGLILDYHLPYNLTRQSNPA